MVPLDDFRALAARESGLAVVVTMRPDGRPRSSVVNVGIIDHPVAGTPVIAFVSLGVVHKLRDLRRRPTITVVVRSGWDWIAAEGTAELAGPDDHPDGFRTTSLPRVLRIVYASAAGGAPEDWASLDPVMAAERHTAVFVHVERVYGATSSDDHDESR